MPNHVTNELTAPKAVLDSIASAESAIDFQKIVQRPAIYDYEPSMNITDWAQIALGAVTLATLRADTPDPVAAFKRGDYGSASKRLRQHNLIRLMSEGPFPKDFNDADFACYLACIQALKQYGHVSWLEWSIANWGTKWNAYSAERVSDTVVRFQTAWSIPRKALAALAEKNPEAAFRLRWADEDFGSNAGDLTFDGSGDIAGGPFMNDSKEAHALAMELLYNNECPSHMKLGADGRYQDAEDAA